LTRMPRAVSAFGPWRTFPFAPRMSALVPHIRGQLLRPTSRRLQNDGTGSVLRFHAKVLLRTAYFHADVGFCGGRKLTNSDTVTVTATVSTKKTPKATSTRRNHAPASRLRHSAEAVTYNTRFIEFTLQLLPYRGPRRRRRLAPSSQTGRWQVWLRLR